ncbi:hypothetical protein CFC21_073284 [Triticum aestivum]|uniref:Receptor-like serine/threonine-protein kinase n=2 Tax=Triticum aestivum TaxID=4565 RepID=A0A3B6LSD3_WHEAT|nr:hypothetical protein CFC21_073284 [Triticum aestivum]
MPPLHILVLGLLLLHTPPWCFTAAADENTLSAGQSLTAGDKLVSRNSKFALGFFQLAASRLSKSSNNATSPSTSWYLGIWFNKIPVFTVAWVANREEPITHPNLNLTQLRSQATTILTQTTNTSALVLLNNGNLALTSEKKMLWQSFDYSTDVVLPGAKFGRNKITGFNQQLISKKSLIDLGLGSYSLDQEDTGGFILERRNKLLVVYWRYKSSTTSSLNLLPLLMSLLDSKPQTKGLFNLSYDDNIQEEYYMYTVWDESSPSAFVSLDISGQIKLNLWSQASQSWQTIYAQPDDPCDAPATCGPFTVCMRKPDPSCDCMDSFSHKSPHDRDFDDRTGGCIRNTPLHCAIYSIGEHVLYLRLVAKDSLPSSRIGKRKPNVGIVIAASIIWFGLLVMMLLLLLWRKQMKLCGLLPICYDHQGNVGGIMAFRYAELVRATKSFFEKLGGGGFGSVYKEMLSDSKASIAMKRLDAAHQGEKQFRAEVRSIGLVQHINLVQLIGFCCEGDHRLLVYAHMVNGSLDRHLFKDNHTDDVAALNWNTRYQITLGVARGLSYLHQSCRECIINCDIKLENILLDGSFLPKVADFGLAACVGRDFSRILTSFRGTMGYLAPEWLSGVAITPKVDVYAFGMVLLEIMPGRRNSTRESSYNTINNSNYQHRLKGFAKLLVGASKTMSLTGRRWVKWSEFLRVYKRLMCPRCQDYLQL